MLPLKRVPSLQGLVMLSAPVVASAVSTSSESSAGDKSWSSASASVAQSSSEGSPMAVDNVDAKEASYPMALYQSPLSGWGSGSDANGVRSLIADLDKRPWGDDALRVPFPSTTPQNTLVSQQQPAASSVFSPPEYRSNNGAPNPTTSSSRGNNCLSDPQQYKTRLCVYLSSAGGCPHGQRCVFAHGIGELRPVVVPTSSTTPTSFGTQRAATPAATEYQRKPCRYSFNDCPFAAVGRCQYAHNLDELRLGAPSSHTTTPRQQQASFAAPQQQQQSLLSTQPLLRAQSDQRPVPVLGGSTSGATTKQHSGIHSAVTAETTDGHAAQQAAAAAANHARRFKTRLCKYHMAGHCPYAATNTCQFAHSEEELRVPPQRTWRPASVDTTQHYSYSAADATNDGQTSPPVVAKNALGAYPNLSGAHSAPSSNGGGVILGGAGSDRLSSSLHGGGSDRSSSSSHGSERLSSSAHGGSLQQQVTSVVQQQGQHQSGAALRAALEQKRFTKLCKYYLAGHCPFSASGTCQFAHSASELRRRSPPPATSQIQRSPPRLYRKSSEPFGAATTLGLDAALSGSVERARRRAASAHNAVGDGWGADAFSGARRQPDWSFRAEDLAPPAAASL
mmetsp:Transcript_17917/g.54795  ORF Transcript_17917/g.54795 Transcript_17917/m.54795 type:complete len:620 (+) Transcript_17917:2056-3915(+)